MKVFLAIALSLVSVNALSAELATNVICLLNSQKTRETVVDDKGAKIGLVFTKSTDAARGYYGAHTLDFILSGQQVLMTIEESEQKLVGMNVASRENAIFLAVMGEAAYSNFNSSNPLMGVSEEVYFFACREASDQRVQKNWSDITRVK